MIGKLAIRTEHGRKIVASQCGGSIPPGLALCLVPLDETDTDAMWSVTHGKSGKRIGPGFVLRGDAQRCAEALADCADWSLPEFALRALPGLEEEVSRALTTFLEGLANGR